MSEKYKLGFNGWRLRINMETIKSKEADCNFLRGEDFTDSRILQLGL